MRTTLFYIPHRFDGDPTGLTVFGFGWLLVLWLLFCVVVLAWTIRTKGLGRELSSLLPVLAIVAVVIAFVLPMLEVKHPYNPDQDPLGLPIRGYGLMVLFGIVGGVGLAAYRAKRMGVDPEAIFSLGFWLFVFGILGARLTFVIENWDKQFAKGSFLDTVKEVANVVEGGLVVYGALIGATVGFLVFVIRRRLPVLAMADLIAPSLLVGLSLGRIGCLLNGCCWGGVCDDQNTFHGLAITFPSADPPTARYILRHDDSPPYGDQRRRGLLQGVEVAESKDVSKQGSTPVITAVDASLMRGLKTESTRPLVPGDRISAINGVKVQSVEQAYEALRSIDKNAPWHVRIETADGRKYRWNLPERSLPVFPTQIFSAINAALIALFLWFFYPFRRRDGEVIALTLTIYPISRFLLERIRVDVPPTEHFGVSLSTSQWISVLMLVAVGLFWVFLIRRPMSCALPPKLDVAK